MESKEKTKNLLCLFLSSLKLVVLLSGYTSQINREVFDFKKECEPSIATEINFRSNRCGNDLSRFWCHDNIDGLKLSW